ncbi:hypothetical protein BKA82DRAFT_4084396 [Pisolithus tinctorius]|nr:hypothetical protein BKA82DRAFT_4084396 [Pisolithus tinctorius]
MYSIPLKLPDSMHSVHPVLHVSQLEAYEVSEILDSKVDCFCWAGYENTDEETSWLLATELDHASDIVSAFHEHYPHKPGPYQPQP